jgi:hypothetical protein
MLEAKVKPTPRGPPIAPSSPLAPPAAALPAAPLAPEARAALAPEAISTARGDRLEAILKPVAGPKLKGVFQLNMILKSIEVLEY